MTPINFVCAFGGGVLSAGLGGYQCFVFCAMLCLLCAVTGAPISGVAFGPFLNPCVTVVSCAVVVAYTNKRKYGGDNHIVTEQLAIQVGNGHYDIYLVGGIAGAVGWLFYNLICLIAPAGMDCVATTVVAMPLLFKAAISGSPCGPLTEEVKQKGGRFSPYNGKPAIAGLRTGMERVIWPAAYGAAIGWIYVSLIQAGIDPSCASLIGFGVGGTLLLFPTVFMSHHVGCTVATVVGFVAAADGGNWYFGDSALSVSVLWGAAIGVLAVFAFNYMSDLFWMHGFYVHIDGPSMSIICITIPGALLAKYYPSVYTTLLTPVVIIAVCLVWAVVIDLKYKKYKDEPALSPQ